MPTLNIEGKKVKVDDSFLSMSPEQQAATVDEIAKQIGAKAAPAQPADPEASPKYQDTLAEMSRLSNPTRKTDGVMKSVDSFMRGAADTASFGTADEISGTLNALTGALNPWSKDFMSPDIKGNIMQERVIQAQRDGDNAVASTTGRIGGALLGVGALAKLGAPFLAALPEASLAARMALGAKSGAFYGGLYGLGSGEGVEGRLKEGATSAVTGGLLGGAIPALAAGVKAAAKPFTDAISARINPEAFADKKIAERLANAGMTAAQSAAKMKNGEMLADVGGRSTQTLLRSTTNIPGKAQTRVPVQLVLRQMQQGDRIKSAVSKTLADPDGYLSAKEEIAATAKQLASPLYEQARATPTHFSKSLEDILDTPAGKEALNYAERLAANERQPFQQFFANVTANGTTIKRVPDTRAWDYIKRGFDAQIETLKTAGKKTEMKAILDLKNSMLREIDAQNPAYAAARKIWSGQMELDDALEWGRDAMKMSPDAFRREFSAMSEAEKQSARIGIASWIRDQVGRNGYTRNDLLKVMGNKDQYNLLKEAFDTPAQFKAFREAMFAEARKRSTYEQVMGNSTTARQLMDLMEAGGTSDVVSAIQSVGQKGMVGATIDFIASRAKMLGGFTPEVADSIARKLTTSNPEAAAMITQRLQQIQNSQLSAAQKQQMVERLFSTVVNQQATTARLQSR